MSSSRVWLLTGGIGSGKSSVGRLLRSAGAEVVDADGIGHGVIAPGGGAFRSVGDRWPQVVEGGHIDRGRLASIVFSNPEALAELEVMTHPHIRSEILRRVESSRSPFIFVEVSVLSVLAESWPVVVVDAPDATRIARLRARGMSEIDAERRMLAQPGRSEWVARADHVIDNSGTWMDLERSVLEFAGAIGLV